MLLKRSDMARDSKGITQFYLPPTHEPYLPLLPSRRASPTFGRYSLRLYPRRDGQAGLTWVRICWTSRPVASTGFGMRGNEVDSRRRSCRDGDERVAMGMGIPSPTHQVVQGSIVSFPGVRGDEAPAENDFSAF